MKTLFVSDLDGTLMQPDAHISAQSVRMLNRAIADGKFFTIATARTPATVAPILQDVNMELPAIVMTGAALWNPADNTYSRLRLFDPDVAKRLIQAYRDTGTPTFVFTLADNLITIRHIGELTDVQRQFLEERSHTPFKRIEVKADGSSTFPEVMNDVILLYTMVPDVQAERTYAVTSQMEGVRALTYHDIYGPDIAVLEAFSPAATKAKAMRALADSIGADRIVAFGDNINDLPMMHEADLAVAVANALPEVREAADIVIGPNTDDSVAKFILHL